MPINSEILLSPTWCKYSPENLGSITYDRMCLLQLACPFKYQARWGLWSCPSEDSLVWVCRGRGVLGARKKKKVGSFKYGQRQATIN